MSVLKVVKWLLHLSSPVYIISAYVLLYNPSDWMSGMSQVQVGFGLFVYFLASQGLIAQMQHGGQLVKGSMDLFMSVATFIMIAALGVFANNDDAGQLWNFIYTMFLIGAVYDLTINNVALLKIFHFTKER